MRCAPREQACFLLRCNALLLDILNKIIGLRVQNIKEIEQKENNKQHKTLICADSATDRDPTHTMRCLPNIKQHMQKAKYIYML